ncbi:MAG: PKD domain-containing protein [Candidatus Thorarchaeota archaeon]
MMKTRKLFFILFIASLFLFSLFPIMNVSAGVDQSCTSDCIYEDVNSESQLAQSFKPTSDTLLGISLRCGKYGSGFGNLIINIREDSVTGDNVKQWTVSSSNIPNYPSDVAWVNFSCDVHLNLASHETYFIVLTSPSTPGGSGTNAYTFSQSCDNPYSRGALWHNYVWWLFPPTWTGWADTGRDLCFKTFKPNEDPVAKFDWDYKATPLKIWVDADTSTDDGEIVLYEWDWTNDGTYDDTGKTADHQFPDYGTYKVRLRVTDDEGATATIYEWVSFSNDPPEAIISTPIYHENLTIQVEGTESNDPDGSITEYAWDWTNDGSYDSYGSTQSHEYSANGTYTVKLRVTDDLGAEDTDSVTITITDGSSGIIDPDPDNGNGGSSGFSGDWLELLLSLPMYVILLIIAIVFVMAGTLAFFIKPEVIGPPGNLGIVPSVSTLFIGILAIIMLILWYAEFEMLYILLCGVLIAVVFALDIKYFFGRKRK